MDTKRNTAIAQDYDIAIRNGRVMDPETKAIKPGQPIR
jgi:hypothetical protein